MELPEEQRVPFAYVNFDSPFINIRDLTTIVAEIYRQLRLQFHEFPAPPAPLTPAAVADSLATLFGRLSQAATQPFLLVLDTFEEVQYGGESQALPLFDLLDGLQTQWPFLRVLISGRVPVQSLTLGGMKAKPLELAGVDEPAALAILANAGVTSPTLARTLIKQVGYVPLSLRLAAAVVAKQGASEEGVKNLETTSYLFFSVSDEVIQGQLYERILGHLHTKGLEKLAHPGLVLRKVDPNLILEVLNEPCGLGISTLAEAHDLYQALAAETALVTVEANGTLHHRPDVRRTMLKLLVDKAPEKARNIRQRAVEYYGRSTEPEAVAEELYHRLMLGERPHEHADDFRKHDVRVSLSRSLQEMPVAAQLFLSAFRL